MYKRKSPYSYQINIPPYVDKEIIKWFETMSANGSLSEELIGMVFENLNNGDFNTCDFIVNKTAPSTANSSVVSGIAPGATCLSLPVLSVEQQSPAAVESTRTDVSSTVSLKSICSLSQEAPNFLDKLYDWEGSNSAMTSDDSPGIPLGGKKKMLSV